MLVWVLGPTWVRFHGWKEREQDEASCVSRAGPAIVAGMWTLSLLVLTILMLSSRGHLHSSEELLFVCTHPVTLLKTHSLRTRPGQGSSFNSGHLLLLSIARLFVISHFPNLFSIHRCAAAHSRDEGCNNCTLIACCLMSHFWNILTVTEFVSCWLIGNL